MFFENAKNSNSQCSWILTYVLSKGPECSAQSHIKNIRQSMEMLICLILEPKFLITVSCTISYCSCMALDKPLPTLWKGDLALTNAEVPLSSQFNKARKHMPHYSSFFLQVWTLSIEALDRLDCCWEGMLEGQEDWNMQLNGRGQAPKREMDVVIQRQLAGSLEILAGCNYDS